jgi:hypothetical protein
VVARMARRIGGRRSRERTPITTARRSPAGGLLGEHARAGLTGQGAAGRRGEGGDLLATRLRLFVRRLFGRR